MDQLLHCHVCIQLFVFTKLALLLALARRPSLLILDEPTEGLDPVSIEELLQTLAGLPADGTTVFFSSHQISEVERIADRVCIIDRGPFSRRSLARRDPPGSSAHNAQLLSPGSSTSLRHARGEERRDERAPDDGAEGIVERAKTAGAVVVDVVPINLRELFLGTVQDHKRCSF